MPTGLQSIKAYKLKSDSRSAALLTTYVNYLINMVNYKYIDQPAPVKSLYENEKLCWNKALWRNEFTNRLTDWYKFEFWLLNLENCWIWLENTRLVNIDGGTVEKILLCEHELQKPPDIGKFKYCKLVQDLNLFIIYWTHSTVLKYEWKARKNRGIYTFFFVTKIVTAQTLTEID